MKLISVIVIAFVVVTFRISAQPPAEIDQAIRATVQELSQSEGTNLKNFINKHYSKKSKKEKGIQSIERDLSEIKKITANAGGVEVTNQNGNILILFSGGTNAKIKIQFNENDLGKINSIELLNDSNSRELTDQEKYENALQGKFGTIESLQKYNEDAEFLTFCNENFADSYLATTSDKELITKLRNLAKIIASATIINARPTDSGNGAVLEFRGAKSADVSFSVEENEPFKINQFDVNADVAPLNSGPANLMPVTWSSYQQLLDAEENKGFSGVVLMVRNGEVVHHAGYGYANRDKKVRNSSKTTFDIGSVPIDFTRAAILKLVDDNRISFSDPITNFFKDVPDDKQSITIDHLMANKSGLHNFHGDDVKDADHDLSWISRDEAINRILSRTLLFEPGTDVSPSHSGYGLLAAIIEIVSGKTYENFLEENFFSLIKMKNTGPYGKDSGVKPESMAVGYGKQVSNPNIPSNWGPTSWLIKGSGGMVSNPSDLYLWNKGLHEGNILSQKSKEIYRQGTIAIGGSERGYFTSYVRSADNTVIICSNSDPSAYPDAMRLFQSLANLYE